MTSSIDLRPVVVGLDGSACSEIAFQAGLVEARRRGVRLLVLHAWLVTQPGLQVEAPVTLHEDTEERLGKALHERVQGLVGDAEVEVEERLEYGYAGRVLVDASADASLLVVGSRGNGALRSALLGSVSQHVLEGAVTPVLIAHGDAHRDTARVVVGVDGSATAAVALLWADDHARRLGVPLTVVHAVTAQGSGLDPSAPPEPSADDARTALLGWTQAALGEQRAAQVELVVEQRPAAPTLLQRSHDDTLLVVGHDGVGGFLRLGSVARRVATHADGPVVVVRGAR